jgi:ribosome-binding factor A
VARDADAEVQRRAAGARYAGDPQPYRIDDEQDMDQAIDVDHAGDDAADEVVGGRDRR